MTTVFWKKIKHWKQRYYYKANTEPNLFPCNINELHCFCVTAECKKKLYQTNFLLSFWHKELTRRVYNHRRQWTHFYTTPFFHLKKILGHFWPLQLFILSSSGKLLLLTIVYSELCLLNQKLGNTSWARKRKNGRLIL